MKSTCSSFGLCIIPSVPQANVQFSPVLCCDLTFLLSLEAPWVGLEEQAFPWQGESLRKYHWKASGREKSDFLRQGRKNYLQYQGTFRMVWGFKSCLQHMSPSQNLFFPNHCSNLTKRHSGLTRVVILWPNHSILGLILIQVCSAAIGKKGFFQVFHRTFLVPHFCLELKVKRSIFIQALWHSQKQATLPAMFVIILSYQGVQLPGSLPKPCPRWLSSSHHCTSNCDCDVNGRPPIARGPWSQVWRSSRKWLLASQSLSSISRAIPPKDCISQDPGRQHGSPQTLQMKRLIKKLLRKVKQKNKLKVN